MLKYMFVVLCFYCSAVIERELLQLAIRSYSQSQQLQPRYHGQRAISIPLIANPWKGNTENQR